MAELVVPAIQPTGVTTAGTIVSLAVPDFHDSVGRILVYKVSGDATLLTTEVSTDSAVADRAKRVCLFENKAEVDILGPFPYASTAKTLYVKVTPNAGTNNSIYIALFLTE